MTSLVKRDYHKLHQYFKEQKLHEEADEILRKYYDLKQPLLVFIVGEGKYGKSTLVNSLCGGSFAVVGRIPETWRVDIYKHSKTNVANLYYKDGNQVKQSVQKAKETCLRYEENHSQWNCDLYQVIWSCPELKLPDNVAIVDTPGFAQLRQAEDQTEVSILGHEGLKVKLKDIFDAYYYRADIVLWIFNARRINDRDTLDAIERLKEHKKKIWGCITYMDFVPLDRRQQICDRARELYGEVVEAFFPLDYLKNKFYDILNLRESLEGEIFKKCQDYKVNADQEFRMQKKNVLYQWCDAYEKAIEHNIEQIDDIQESIFEFEVDGNSKELAFLLADSIIYPEYSFSDTIQLIEENSKDFYRKYIASLSAMCEIQLQNKHFKCVRQSTNGLTTTENGISLKVYTPPHSNAKASLFSRLHYILLVFGSYLHRFLIMAAGILTISITVVAIISVSLIGIGLALLFGSKLGCTGVLVILVIVGFVCFLVGEKLYDGFLEIKDKAVERHYEKTLCLIYNIRDKVFKKVLQSVVKGKRNFNCKIQKDLNELLSHYLGTKTSRKKIEQHLKFIRTRKDNIKVMIEKARSGKSRPN